MNVIATPNIPPNNTGAETISPRREWYVRADRDSALFGPMDFKQADMAARSLTKAELCTYIGSNDRAGDPVVPEPVLSVVYLYVMGRRVLGGRTAAYHSEHELPTS